MGKRTAVSLHAFPGCLGCILTLLPCSRILTIGGGKSSNMLHSNFQSVSIGENGEVYWWPSLSRLETIASGLEAIAPRVEAIASRLECLFLEEYSLLSWHWADAPNPAHLQFKGTHCTGPVLRVFPASSKAPTAPGRFFECFQPVVAGDRGKAGMLFRESRGRCPRTVF